jgi:hypothetical protein
MKKDTILFKNNNITVTADDVKLDIDTSFVLETEISIFVDVSKYYKIQYHKKNKYRNRKLIYAGSLYIDMYDKAKEIQLIKFFDEDCRISNLELIDEDGYASYFSNDCARIDIYKKYPTLANTESFIRETYNYDKYTGLQRVKISSIKDNILNIVRRAVEPTIFNNDKFIYKVYYDNSYNFAYEYLISKKHGHQ